MENTSERVLRNLVYYSLILVAVALSALFVARVATTGGMAMWIQVIYYIWTVVLLLVLACDVACVIMKKSRCYLGYILYGLLIAAIVMAIILFTNLNVINALGTATEVTYIGLMKLCFIPAILAVVAYFTGRKIIEQKT